MSRVVSILFTGVLVGAALAGCGSSGGPQRVPTAPPAAPPSNPATSSRPVAAAVPSATGFPTAYAVACLGHPDAAQVVAVLRSSKVLAATAAPALRIGPLCSGGWQYTAFDVAELGPLEVVTKGEPGALELVTAGTDVCTPAVASQAPPGIRVMTRC